MLIQNDGSLIFLLFILLVFLGSIVSSFKYQFALFIGFLRLPMIKALSGLNLFIVWVVP